MFHFYSHFIRCSAVAAKVWPQWKGQPCFVPFIDGYAADLRPIQPIVNGEFVMVRVYKDQEPDPLVYLHLTHIPDHSGAVHITVCGNYEPVGFPVVPPPKPGGIVVMAGKIADAKQFVYIIRIRIRQPVFTILIEPYQVLPHSYMQPQPDVPGPCTVMVFIDDVFQRSNLNPAANAIPKPMDAR